MHLHGDAKLGRGRLPSGDDRGRSCDQGRRGTMGAKYESLSGGDPFPSGRGSRSCPTRQQRVPVCREIPRECAASSPDEVCRTATPDVALARGCPPVPGMCTRLVPAHAGRAKAGNTLGPFAGLLSKPSDGLEPSTPSLPWRIQPAKEGLRNSACWRVFPATTPLRRSDASFPRRAFSLPQEPRTCPQYLSPDPRRTAPRPSIAPRGIRRNLARPRRSSRVRSSHDCWQHREASAQMRQCS
jgi:hypothetical protein